MRLYSRMGVIALDDPDYGTFRADEQGGFDFPDDVSDRLHGFHHQGKPMWETDVERQQRLMSEELERRKDPATLLSAVEQLVKAAAATSALTAPAPAPPADLAPAAPAPAAPTAAESAPATPAPEPTKSPRKRAASKPSAQ
ncbi:hypothetical protein ACFVY4_26610 [Streptomyces sp. NPDC058299]|uniref:hypothetical protein n=1 Tax=Streptomyces sp. NPDC058299 TaxID=3346435 RepID=UPI0036E7CCC5